MADIDNGAMSFTSTMDNEQMNLAIDETLRRIQGLSDGTVEGTMQMSDAFDATAEGVRNALGAIGAACEQHEVALEGLRAEYDRLGKEQSKAFTEGRGDDVRAIQQSMNAVKVEINVREKLLHELREASNELEEEASALEHNSAVVKQNDAAHVSLKSRIKEIKEQMADMVTNGIDQQSEAYIRLRDELGRLMDIQGDIQAQGSILANDEAQFQGIITGFQGVAGAMSAAAGAYALFGEQNEHIQQIMLKVQSLMSITMGLQQMSQALNKDSAFMISTIGGLKQWWAGVVAQATAAETAETTAVVAETVAEGENAAATGANTAAQVANTTARGANATAMGAQSAASTANAAATGAQTAAATAGTAANIGLAGAFRMVGVAIKSIPVFGWILAGISAVISLVAIFTGKSKEATEQQKKWNEAEEEGAKAYITARMELNGYIEKLDKFNGSQAEEQRLVDEVNNKYGEQLGYVKTVKEAKELLTSKGEAYCEMLKLEAIAQGLLNEATAAYINILKTKQKAEAGEFDDEWYEFWNWGGKSSEDKRKEAIANAEKDYQYWLDEYEKMRSKAAQYKTDHGLGGWEDPTKVEIKGGGNGSGSNSTKHQKTPEEERAEKFKKLLDGMRSEYDRFNKWMNSGDAILVASAQKEFEGLLAQGATYIDFLKKQREQLSAISANDRTAEQNEQLAAINNQIAEETRQTVLESFNNELNAQLANAKTVIEMLNIIEERRKELANDGTELDNDKATALNNAEKNVMEQAKSEYESMLKEYGSFEEKKQRIIDEYEAKRAIARQQNNEALVQSLNDAQAKAISELAQSELMESGLWESLFGNLDELTASQIKTIVSEIERQFDSLSGVFNPVDLKAVRDKLNEAKAIIVKDNPFKQMGLAIKEIFKDAGDDSKTSAEKIKKNWKKLGDATEASFEFVNDAINSCDFLKDAIGDVGATAIASMQTCAITAISVATAIKTAEKASVILAIIQAALVVVQAVVNVVKSIFGNKDAKIEKQIGKWKESVDALKDSYNQLSWEIDKALGGSVYKHQKQAIANMKEQQRYLEQMWQAEESKKKTDSSKVRDYKEQYAQLERDIADMMDEIANDLLQTDAKSFADQLGDALAEAFGKGEDAARAMEETVNEVLKNIVLNQLKKNFLENQLQGVLDQLQNSMGYWDGDEFHFNGLSDEEIAAFKNKVASIASTYTQALEQYSDIFKGLTDAADDDSTLVGAVKGVTEQTAEVISGQMQAIRINQAESIELMRGAIESLARIANNTSYNYHLAKLERIVSLLESNSTDAALRANGIQV